jgi:hypothetical protein
MEKVQVNKTIEMNTKIYEFLKFTFTNKRDLFCAKVILSSLPFDKGTGQQQTLIDNISQEDDPFKKVPKFPNAQQHYWRTLKKLKLMNMVMEESAFTQNSPNREILQYRRNVQGFAKYLNAVILSWLRVCGEEKIE